MKQRRSWHKEGNGNLHLRRGPTAKNRLLGTESRRLHKNRNLSRSCDSGGVCFTSLLRLNLAVAFCDTVHSDLVTSFVQCSVRKLTGHRSLPTSIQWWFIGRRTPKGSTVGLFSRALPLSSFLFSVTRHVFPPSQWSSNHKVARKEKLCRQKLIKQLLKSEFQTEMCNNESSACNSATWWPTSQLL